MQSLESAFAAIKSHHEESRAEAARRARETLTKDLNQISRRLRQYETEDDWSAAVIDGAALFAREAALFGLQGGNLRLRGVRGLGLSGDLSFKADSARAFSHATAAKETVVALRSEAEVGAALSTTEANARAFVFPIQNVERVAALLFASGSEQPDVPGLELVAGIASLALRKQNSSGLATLEVSEARVPRKETANAGRELPPWSALNQEQRGLHSRAQRFARLRVAEMQLAKAENCRAGIEQNDLYLFLKNEIEAARESYRAQFMTSLPMIDYLHLELVRTAAEGDESKLGAEYPGPLD